MRVKLLAYFALASLTSSFAPQAFLPRKLSLVGLSSSPDDVNALLEAAKKLREEADAASVAMGKAPTASDDSTSADSLSPSRSPADLSTLSALDFSNAEALLSSTSRFASPPPSTMGLRPFPVTLDGLKQRSNNQITAEALGVGGEDDVSLDDFKYATIGVTLVSSLLAVGAGVALPNNTGATLTYLFAVIPVLWIGVGSSSPGILAGLIEATKGTSEDEEAKRRRVCYHEAAHFLCGYIVGLPIKSYEASTSAPRVEFFDTSTGDAPGGPNSFDDEQVAQLAVVSMAGAVGEALSCEGGAKGGDQDLIALQDVFSRSKEFIGAAKQQEMTRWGALIAYQIINEDRGRFESLAEALGEGKSVAECAALIEK